MIPILSAILPIAETVIGRLVPDKNAKQKAMIEMEKALVNAHAKGRICAAALGFHFIVTPVVQWAGSIWGFHLPTPDFDMSSLMTILLGMLGIGGMRSFEKFKGLTK